MPPIGIWELLIILAVVLVIFGPKRLKNLGSEIGNSIKGFRNAMKEQDQEDSQITNESTADQSSKQDPPKQTHA
ncbi:MAG: twin-arginine translocase TatA/TatE family subunit [Gammaproteobacteria bacterium]|nr:twin-arginine translocase TatA/TatE family subunit [Gammaproteobacteria bacterium]